jgi:hypothetical protein
MKDSGVPSLGEVPEHWELRKLRSVLRGVTERNRPDLPLLSVVREKGVILRDVTNPTVCLDVISLVASSYGYENGKNGPIRYALIDDALGDKCRAR